MNCLLLAMCQGFYFLLLFWSENSETFWVWWGFWFFFVSSISFKTRVKRSIVFCRKSTLWLWISLTSAFSSLATDSSVPQFAKFEIHFWSSDQSYIKAIIWCTRGGILDYFVLKSLNNLDCKLCPTHFRWSMFCWDTETHHAESFH